MPINYKKYPSNWKSEIRPTILKRADNCCENCGIRNYSVGYRTNKRFVGTYGNIVHDLAGQGLSYPSLNLLSYCEAKEICEVCNNSGLDEKYIVIVLTIAHLDHDTNNNCLENLQALCQSCHLSYDSDFHRKNARNTINNRKGLVSLFDFV